MSNIRRPLESGPKKQVMKRKVIIKKKASLTELIGNMSLKRRRELSRSLQKAGIFKKGKVLD